MTQLFVFLVSVAITLVIQVSGFAVAFALQTETFYDILGGVNFMALAAFTASSAAWADDPRKILSTLVFVCSRGWLLCFLAWRAHSRGGDSRFDGVKDKFLQFLVYWLVQGMWVMMISMPILFVNSSNAAPGGLNVYDSVMLGGFAVGVALEVVADVQKSLWVRAGRVGGFCRDGIWGYSRHPNYFGEILQWWCAWGIAYSASSAGLADPLWWACSISPLFTCHILFNIPATGIAQAEGRGLKRYYENDCAKEYKVYRAQTSILMPMVGYEHVPLSLKRTIFMDFARYEYRPKNKSGNGSQKKSD